MASAWFGRLAAVLAIFLAAAFIALAAWLGKSAAQAVAAVGFLVFVAVGATGWLLYRRLIRPIDRLALDIAIIGRDNPDYPIHAGAHRQLDRLVAAVENLRRRLQRNEKEVSATLADAIGHAEEQKRRLEAILLDLNEGIVVCNLQHQILLYNQAATALIDPPLQLGLGRSIFAALAPEPVEHAIERLNDTQRRIGDHFVCGTADGRRLLQARLGLMLSDDRQPLGYVLALRDVGSELAAAARRDNLLDAATEGFRAPLANLRAAAETLSAHPDAAREQREAFERVLLKESAVLSERLEAVAREYREIGAGLTLMAEIHSTDLVRSLQRRLQDTPIRLTAVGLPVWVYGDSLSLLVLLEHLARRLEERLGMGSFDMAFNAADGRVYLDLIWPGFPVQASALDGWLEIPLRSGLGTVTGRSVLQRHGSEMWSQPGRPGEALLRMPLPSAERRTPAVPRAQVERPEFYDFELLRRPLPTGDIVDRSLRQLTYVVFDLETTGLRPSEGDEVVELGAVRVVNGRVLTLETFQRVVNPRRAIPPESIKFHGITEEMVKEKPPLPVVLPQFHEFAADSVLVAHNAAFDIKFINRGAAECGVTFEQPVLDTLLISAFLDPAERDHSLDAIAQRLGLAVTRRHSALGDALVTAAILVRVIERLEERGLSRLGDLITATGMAAEIRIRQLQF
jgi:DNA polymerase-3 subunit epsilon